MLLTCGVCLYPGAGQGKQHWHLKVFGIRSKTRQHLLEKVPICFSCMRRLGIIKNEMQDRRRLQPLSYHTQMLLFMIDIQRSTHVCVVYCVAAHQIQQVIYSANVHNDHQPITTESNVHAHIYCTAHVIGCFMTMYCEVNAFTMTLFLDCNTECQGTATILLCRHLFTTTEPFLNLTSCCATSTPVYVHRYALRNCKYELTAEL